MYRKDINKTFFFYNTHKYFNRFPIFSLHLIIIVYVSYLSSLSLFVTTFRVVFLIISYHYKKYNIYKEILYDKLIPPLLNNIKLSFLYKKKPTTLLYVQVIFDTKDVIYDSRKKKEKLFI